MRSLLLIVLGLAASACTPDTPKKGSAGPESASAKPESAPVTAPVPPVDEEEVLRNEIHRAGVVDLEKMGRLLSGTDAERRWAPFALGLGCTRENAESHVAQLVSAVGVWMSEPKTPSAENLRTAAWAMGACASPDVEDILRGWLSPNPASEKTGLTEAAVFGLGTLADRQGTLTERTQTALLDAASRQQLAELLLPLGRIGRLSDAVGAHILEVTGNLLTTKDAAGKRQAIFALGSAGGSAAAPLAQVLLAETYSAQERAAAAQALSRLGTEGQEALDETLKDILERGLPVELDRELWVPLRAIMEGLESTEKSRKQLAELSTVVLSEGPEREKQAQRRRMIWLRCQAARLLAKSKYNAKSLLECDPDQGTDFALAQLTVLGEEPLAGARKKIYAKYLENDDPRIVQAALRMLAEHSEVSNSAQLLEKALTSPSPGTVATAAQIIAAYPSRAHESTTSDGPSEKVITLLQELLTVPDKDDTVPSETRAAVIKAAGALGALSLKPAVEKLCASNNFALWKPAEQSLSLLGAPKATCPPEPIEQSDLPTPSVPAATIVIDSDVGELLLHIDARDAPASAAHFLGLVDAGFYNGLKVHGARAGFAVQFGDKDGDGYQDAPSQPLPHEVSPQPFDARSVGMTAFSPGSQDAQIFVVVSDAPQLHGTRVRLGRAEGPWHLLTVGDIFHSVKRR